ncbi:MAG UNVERIFIED_CONTAM: oligosaccharide flippase family protein [Planctomycetaceae bacterium]|jgi:O-antigen/teichoic acid export membrane protein
MVWTLAVRVLGVLLAFLSTTVTARVLGPEEFGAWSAGLSLAMLFAALAPLGMDRVLVRQLSVLSDSGERAQSWPSHTCLRCVSAVCCWSLDCLPGASVV